MRWMLAASSTVGNWAKAVAAAMAPIQTSIFRPSRLIRGNKKGRAGGPALVSPKRKLLLFALLHLFLLVHRLGAGMGHRHSRTARNGEHSGHQDGDQLPHIFLSVELTIGLRPVLCLGTSPSP